MLKDAGTYVDKFALNYGMKDQNPVDHVTFYNRNNDTEGRKKKRNAISNMTPKCFQEFYVRLYVKNKNENVISLARTAFDSWVEDKFNMGSANLIVPSTPNSPSRSSGRPRKRSRSSSSSSSNSSANAKFSSATIAIRELTSIEEEEMEE
jgi:hypothetical protein